MSYIDIRLFDDSTKRISLDRQLDGGDALALAQYLSDRLDVLKPYDPVAAKMPPVPEHLNLLALIAALYERIETLEREQ